MNEAERSARQRICDVALEWVGTPYHELGEIKGSGVDCAKLLKCVAVEAGVVPNFEIEPYPPQFFLHKSEERYLSWVLKFTREIDFSGVLPGDVVLYKTGLCFAHGAFVVAPGWPHIVHAHYGARRVREGFGTSVHLGAPIRDMKFFSVF